MSNETVTEKTPKTAFVIRHITSEKLGTFSHVFNDLGIDYHYIEAAHDNLDAIDPTLPDLFFVMGGPCGVYDSVHFPFLDQEVKMLEKRLAAGKPTMGVCLGSQLMAKALGSNVYKGRNGLEVGWNPVAVNEAGMQKPVRHLDQSVTNMLHWHGDTFDLPEGATLLGSSDKYENQMYQYGDNALGIQCHPEVTHKMIKEWFIQDVKLFTGDNPVVPIEDLKAQTEKHIETMHEQTKKFLKEWIEEVL